MSGKRAGSKITSAGTSAANIQLEREIAVCTGWMSTKDEHAQFKIFLILFAFSAFLFVSGRGTIVGTNISYFDTRVRVAGGWTGGGWRLNVLTYKGLLV